MVSAIDLFPFYRFVLRSGDRSFAVDIEAMLRDDPELHDLIDRELCSLPRGDRSSQDAADVLGSLVDALGLHPA